MADVLLELSSIASGLDEITRRISRLGEELSGIDARSSHPDPAHNLAHELFEVERALRAGQRRLDKLTE